MSKTDGRSKEARARKKEKEAALRKEWDEIHQRTSACPLCSPIPDSLFCDYIRDPESEEKIPPGIADLVSVKHFVYLGFFLMQCPSCGTYYRHEHSCGYMEHDDSWDRILDSEAKALLG